MRRFLWIVGVAVLWPSTAVGGSCTDFPWQYPKDMVMPLLIANGQVTLEEGLPLEAREYFSAYLLERQEGVFAEGARWMLAGLPAETDPPGNEFLEQIKRLEAMKVEHPDSVYAPWALCSMGQLYWEADWHSEAHTLFEEFLEIYPSHPLAGGVMVEAGMGYLENQQYLEAALILRRVVEEPKWEVYRIKGALGLADATAMSTAWKQADYWYQVVEAEAPELIRQSVFSLYYCGLTEFHVGRFDQAITRFLTLVNLHPNKKFTGQALNHISEILMKNGYTFLSLWFADHTKRRFHGQEAGRRGQADQMRWIVNHLSEEHTDEDWENMYKRLNDLDIFLSVSWDNVVETARSLSQSPEQDLIEESVLWLGKGYLSLSDNSAAIESFRRLALIATSETWRHEAVHQLSAMLNQQLNGFFVKQAWVSLLKFHEDQQEIFHLVPLTRERVRAVAQAYRAVNLPSKAMQWYDQLLQDYPKSPLREDIFAQRVFLAEDQNESELIQTAGETYLLEYPQGQWRAEVSTALGLDSVKHQGYAEAIQQFTDVLALTHDQTLMSYVLRNRALAYQEMGKRDLALVDIQQVVSLDPLDMANVIRLGDFLFDQGEYADAELQYDHVLESEASVALKAWAKYRWGLSLDYQGKVDEAQKLLREVRQLETQSPEFENTIRAAAVAVLDEFSLSGKPQLESINSES